MIQPSLNQKHGRLVPYLCRFQLVVQDLEAQLYFASSFKVAWKTKDNDELAATHGFVAKNQANVVRFDETLEAQTIMLYDNDSRSYVDKDTFIMVSYFSKSKQNQVKDLGKITLKMNRLMDQNGDSTVRKGESGTGSARVEENGVGIFSGGQKRSVPLKHKQSDESKCLRLEGGQHLAKLRFKCTLISSTVSKLSLSSISAQEFDQPISELMKTPKKSVRDSSKAKVMALSIKPKELPRQQSRKSLKQSVEKRVIRQKSAQQTTQLAQKGARCQSNSQSFMVEQQQLKQSNHTQNTKQSAFQQSLLIPSAINEPYKNEHQEKLFGQLQHLEKQNLKLASICESQKQYILEQDHTIQKFKSECYQLEDELKEKELYFENNLHKLQALDHCKYELIELRDYVAKLQERLMMIYGENRATLEQLFKTATGFRESLNAKPSRLNKKASLSQSIVKMSSITLIDDNNSDQKKGLTQSLNYIRPTVNRDSRQKQTCKSIPEHHFLVSSSEIELTNSEMRQIDGSTVRMQKELSFMQTELYEVKGNVMLQQDRYEAECMMHSETKMELFNLQEKMKSVEKQMKSAIAEKELCLRQLTQLQQDNECLHQEIDKLQQGQSLMRQQAFKARQGKEQQEYGMSLSMRHQKIQLQSLKQQLSKQTPHIMALQHLLTTQKQKLRRQNQESLKMKHELSYLTKQNFRLSQDVQKLTLKETEINSYLSGLEGQFEEVQKIVEEKEDNEEQLHRLILEKEELIDRGEVTVAELQHQIANLKHMLHVTQTELTLQILKLPPSNSETDGSKPLKLPASNSEIHGSKSPRQKETNQKLSILQASNNDLIKKNKQLIAVVSKNATSLVAYERQKQQLPILNTKIKDLTQIKKQHEQLTDEHQKLINDHQTLTNQFKSIETTHFKNLQKINHDRQILNELIENQRKNHLQLLQSAIKLKNQLSEITLLLQEKNHKLSENQTKLQKVIKQKKLLEESLKFTQSKAKNYQSNLLVHQSTITEKQSMIKSLESKLKTLEHQHFNSNSLKASSYGIVDEGLSEIKLESEIGDSRNMRDSRNVHRHYYSASNSKNNGHINMKNQAQRQNSYMKNSYMKKDCIQESAHNQSSYLISPLSENQQQQSRRQSAWKAGQQVLDHKKKKVQKERTSMLINMLQSYLDIKIQADRNQQISGISEKLKKLSDNNYAQTHQVQVLENIAKTVHEVKNQLNRYKTTLIKDNKSKSKSSLNSLIESLKPIEKGLDSLVSTIAAL